MAKKKNRRGQSRFTVPLAVVAGFAPLGYDIYNGAKSNGFNGALQAATSDLSGYNISNKTWVFGDLVKGWTPIIAGFVAHKIASVFGINRLLGRAGVPIIRI